MNKTAKGILIGAGVLVLLSGALVALKLTEPESGTSSGSTLSSEDTNSTLLWEVDESTVKSIAVTYGGDSYTVVPTDPTQDEDGNTIFNYTLENAAGLNVDTVTLRTVASRAVSITTVNTVEEHATDLAQYGLDKPRASVTLTLEDGTVKAFSVGDASPLSSQTYFALKGETTVYTVASDKLSPFLKQEGDYLNKAIVPERAEDDNTILSEILIQRKDLDYDIRLKYDSFYAEMENGGTTATHIMTEPVPCNISPERGSKITVGMYGLTASGVVKLHPTEADLATYGLQDPFCTMTVTSDAGVTQTLKIGNTFQLEGDDTTYYYGYYDGVDVVYSFTAETAPCISVMPRDISSGLVFTTYVWDIGKLTVEAKDRETMAFVGSGTSKEDYQVQLNGKDADTERYRQFYVFLLKTAAEDLCLNGEKPTGELLAKITLERQDGLKTQTVSFYEAENRKVYIEVDGVCAFMCRRSFVDTLFKNMDMYDTDEEFILNW